jgi:hypothetical protein
VPPAVAWLTSMPSWSSSPSVRGAPQNRLAEAPRTSPPDERRLDAPRSFAAHEQQSGRYAQTQLVQVGDRLLRPARHIGSGCHLSENGADVIIV